jgi:hypothetical protein
LLSSVLNLPEAFGSAYVGETFSCTLCANNELNAADTARAVSGVRIQGEMQTPSNPAGSPLDLAGALDAGDVTVSPAAGESLQRILRFELTEEGNHVLAVTVTYTETVLAVCGRSGNSTSLLRNNCSASGQKQAFSRSRPAFPDICSRHSWKTWARLQSVSRWVLLNLLSFCRPRRTLHLLGTALVRRYFTCPGAPRH